MARTDVLREDGYREPRNRTMDTFGDLVVGCCTALLDRPLFARLNMLQVASQTIRPSFHSLVASGPGFDRHFLDDLIAETTLFTCTPQPATTLACYARGMQELYAKGVNLFLCLDHDCVYKTRYVESVCTFVKNAGLDANEGMFCLNLIDQQWITLYDDARADLEERSFRTGFGAPAGDTAQPEMGAPPTFVFGLGAAKVIIDHVQRGAHAPNGYHDQPWRRALAEAGIRITQVQTLEPVFAYLRHTNNLCWGGRPVGLRQDVRKDGPTRILPARSRPNPLGARRSGDGVEVSVIVPTYNEGIWLNKTVESVRDSDNDLRYEIIVVDDGCTDGSVRAIDAGDDLRVVTTGGKQLGLIVAKNVGAKAARGKYLCFVDSHMVVHHHWLDYLRETCDAYPEGCLVSGNLPDVARFQTPDQPDPLQYGYIIRNCLLGTGWHLYGCARTDQAYLEPLTPGGLMLTQKAHFARLGGFAPELRKWGSEDIQISLQNYYVGGENVVDPRVVVYHYYKYGQTKRTFSVTNAQSGFNSLYVAAAYFPPDYYGTVREAFLTRLEGPGLVAEIESCEIQERLEKMRSDFVRGFDDWTTKFEVELRKFFADVEQRSPAAGQCVLTA